jgi:hypothetical protein
VGTVGFDANAEDAWAQSQRYGDPGVVVAILDTGVDIGHPDLRLIAGWDYGSGDNNPDDDSAQKGHGTACAGIAAAVADNGIGPAGIAGGVSIMPLKVADNSGAIYISAVQNAIYHAADRGVDIISMSFGAPLSNNPATDQAIYYAYANGVTLFAATGNENAPSILYPANNPYVIAVGAASPCGDRKRSSRNPNDLNPGVFADPHGYTCDGERWWGSNFGDNIRDAPGAVDIIAPTILPTTDIRGINGYVADDYYNWFNGTSAATPYAAGVAALMISANPTLSPPEIRLRIAQSAYDIVNVESGEGWDRYSGYGMINAGAAGYILLPSNDAFGKIMGGDQTHVNEVNYYFEGRTGDIQLDYEVWDVDSRTEVQILLNGVEVGFAPRTGNEAWSGAQVLPLPDRLVNDTTENYLTFNNTANPPNAYWWGVRSVAVRDWDGYRLPSNEAFGKIMGGDQRHVNEVNYYFEGRTGDIQLEYEVWDVDSRTEVQILFNGVEIGFAPLTDNEAWSRRRVLTIPDHLVNDTADNYLTFNNTANPPNAYWWGVRSVAVSAFGYPLPSAEALGKIREGDQRHANAVHYMFEGRTGDIQLDYDVWDVDSRTEVQIVLNGVEVGFAPLTGNEAWSGAQVLPIPDRLVNDTADNYLTFNNTANPPNAYWWGVRSVAVQ